MANYQNLKAAISAAIRTNGNQEITGQVLQDVLNSIVSVIGANYTFAGVATPATNPGTPDQNVMYLAMEGGTYTNFNGTVLPAGISLLMWNGSWTSETVMYGDGGVFDISVYKSSGGTLATFADLAAALNGGNNIPVGARKGGMSVKFVQSSDNKYVQYRLTADEWSSNTEDWAIADEGVYVDNPEFVYVKTDAENKIIWAIKKDGGIYYGAGVPPQVIEYVEEKLAELSLDEYEDIVAFLNDLEKGDKTLQDLLNEKVDKEEGKSLIPTQYIQEVENHEYIEVKTDAEDKILEATEKDGTKLFGGDVKVLGSIDINGVTYKVVSNPEWLEVVLDAEDRIICGIKTDGKFVAYVADFLDDIEAIKKRLKELDAYSVIESPEFMEVELDADDKILSGRKVDGTKFENNDVELNGNATVSGSFEVDGVVVKNIEDPERRLEIAIDSEDKIISYRKDDGTKVESVGVESPKITTDSFNLSESGMTEFQQALKDSGFKPGGAGNFSDSMTVELPEPAHYALLNLIVDGLPLEDEDISEGYAEYYDKAGNYWKKPIELAAQGQTSRIFARTGGKGNYTMDIVDDSEIKFGSWVPQDSFHLKGCAKDVVRGILPISYKWAYLMQEYLGSRPNRVLMDENAITTTYATGERITDWPTDARCLPDGFPVEVYLNGEYWGLYSWQLKKHRKNYSMDKKDYTSFFIDADAIMTSNRQHGIWNDGPADWWTKFDIKGPKDLYCMDGSKFDGDAPQELIDSTSPYYDSSNKAHKGSKTTKELIESFQTRYLEVKALIDNNSIADAKVKFNENFDYLSCMQVYIFNCLNNNRDSIMKNTLWGMYKGGKIFAALWDLDGMFGEGWIGNSASVPVADLWKNVYATAAWPLKLLWDLYKEDIMATYTNLRKEGIITLNTLHEIIFKQWVNRIGEEAYTRDIKKWAETPSYRENYTNKDYWEEMELISNIETSDVPLWDETEQYSVGDYVALKCHPQSLWAIKYKAIQASNSENPQCPVTQFYEGFPQVGGFFDSPKRWEKWMSQQIVLCDVVNKYFDEVVADFTIYRTTEPDYTINCVDMSIVDDLSASYSFIEGHITRHEIEVDNQTVSIYAIYKGNETEEDTSKTYISVREAIEAASLQPVDIPSEDLFYIQARTKDEVFKIK